MNMSKNKTNRFMPFIMAFCVVIGIIIGKILFQPFLRKSPQRYQ